MVIAITVMAITICKYNAILLNVQAFRAIISHHLPIFFTTDDAIPLSIPHSTPLSTLWKFGFGKNMLYLCT